jgi:ribosomal-protein-alanine N-acetyltransferase
MEKLKQMESRAQLRWLIRRDMDRVMEIERRSFRTQGNEWDEEEFITTLRNGNCIGTVLDPVTIAEDLYGFMIYELHKERLKILRMAVHPELRRTGCGTQMIQRLKDKLDQQRRYAIDADVCETNLDAQLFFRDMGFRAIGVLKRYYEDKPVIRFTYEIPGGFVAAK